MSKQKGRGGKRQKYSIADIGGGDLTSQDVSTERVLNFLIRGGLPGAEGQEEAGGAESVTAPVQEAPPLDGASLPPMGGDATRATGGSPPRRSLDHLFNRANRGPAVSDTTPTVGLIIEAAAETNASELPAPPPPTGSTPHPDKLLADNNLTLAPGSPAGSPLTDEAVSRVTTALTVSAKTLAPDARPREAEAHVSSAPAPAESSSPAGDLYEVELTRQVERWKVFYRLKDGEVSALSTLFRLSHAVGSSECYVKMHQLAEASNLTYRYCQKVVRSLEQLGWIVKLRDYDASTQMGVLYRVNLKPTE